MSTGRSQPVRAAIIVVTIIAGIGIARFLLRSSEDPLVGAWFTKWEVDGHYYRRHTFQTFVFDANGDFTLLHSHIEATPKSGVQHHRVKWAGQWARASDDSSRVVLSFDGGDAQDAEIVLLEGAHLRLRWRGLRSYAPRPKDAHLEYELGEAVQGRAP